ncbi:very-short-patch-repair endonuclease [Conexibacter arvalis]|uniref:Very-short-patch-repair endonuclease n=1 Tax=Conexibacter arvalis TaxID=912552 RepID=A0A840IHE4_9ACTN|nr:very-short-patch-repair endonuclease [Conexibacter arvalis]
MSRAQLLDMGMTARVVDRRVRAGLLVRLHRGVYAVGHRRLTREGEWLAAVLAAGPGAALSHRSAAALHGLLPERGRRVDVTTAARRRTTNWVEVHTVRQLGAEDVIGRAGIPVTTIARTLVDLAGLVARDDLERAVNEADVLRALDVEGVLACAARVRGRRDGGHAALEAVLARHHGPVVLRSGLERRFRALLQAHGLPAAEHNVRVGRWEVDALWRAERLAVELDSARFHDTAAARARDVRKSAELEAAGWTVRRYRKRHLVGARGNATAAELRGLLGRAAADGAGPEGGVAAAAGGAGPVGAARAGGAGDVGAAADGGQPEGVGSAGRTR